MKIIDRYLAKTIINATLLIVLMLASLTFFVTIVREVTDLGTGTYGFFGALEYVLLDLPKQVYQLFPMASLLGVVFGLSTLANHNELTVLRASGYSLHEITKSVTRAILFLLVVATLLGELLAPLAESYADTRKALLTSNGQTLTTRVGTWIRDGQNFIYIHTILGNSHLKGISRYQFDNQNHLISASYAKTGTYLHHNWLMQDIVTSHITLKKIETTRSATADWQLTINPKLLRIAQAEAEEMSLPQLYTYIDYLKTNNLNYTNYSLNFWQRIFQPLATVVMVWLAIPFVFGSLRSVTMSLRLIMGIVVGFSFYMLNQLFGPLTMVYQLSPFFAALIPTLLFALAAQKLMKKVS